MSADAASPNLCFILHAVYCMIALNITAILQRTKEEDGLENKTSLHLCNRQMNFGFYSRREVRKYKDIFVFCVMWLSHA